MPLEHNHRVEISILAHTLNNQSVRTVSLPSCVFGVCEASVAVLAQLDYGDFWGHVIASCTSDIRDCLLARNSFLRLANLRLRGDLREFPSLLHFSPKVLTRILSACRAGCQAAQAELLNDALQAVLLD